MRRANVAPFAALAVLLSACAIFVREVPVDNAPPAGAEAACFKACVDHVPSCRRIRGLISGISSSECSRGCNLVLDRLAEHEGAAVIACVARIGGRCDDRVWAHCGAWVGAHADGGPPEPAPAHDDVEE